MAVSTGYTGMAKMVVQGEIHGQRTNNVLWMGLFGTVSDANWTQLLTNLASAMVACIQDTFIPFASNEWKPISIKAQVFDPFLSNEVEVPFTTLAGAVAGDSTPSYVSAVVKISTAEGGKQNRGRMYLPGVPESGQALSKLTDAQYTLLLAYVACVVAQFITDVSTGEWRLGVFSRKRGYDKTTKVYNMSAGWKPAVSLTARKNLGSTNSRKLGRGI